MQSKQKQQVKLLHTPIVVGSRYSTSHTIAQLVISMKRYVSIFCSWEFQNGSANSRRYCKSNKKKIYLFHTESFEITTVALQIARQILDLTNEKREWLHHYSTDVSYSSLTGQIRKIWMYVLLSADQQSMCVQVAPSNTSGLYSDLVKTTANFHHSQSLLFIILQCP